MGVRVEVTKAAEKDLRKAPVEIQERVGVWLKSVLTIGLEGIRQQGGSGLHDEPLKGKRLGQRSVRLNRAWRLIYTVQNGEIKLYLCLLLQSTTTAKGAAMKDALKLMEELVGPVTVGMLLRAHRTGHDLDLKAMATKLGVTLSYISNVETGKKSISLGKTLEICKKLKENERLWMTVFFEEAARKEGKNIKVSISDPLKKRKAI